MRPLTVALIICALLPTAFTQDNSTGTREKRRSFTLKQAVMNPRLFLGRGLFGLQWHPDGKSVTCLKRSRAGVGLHAIDAMSGKTHLLLSAEALAEAAKAAKAPGVNLNSLMSATWQDDGRLRFVADGRVYYLDTRSRTLTHGIAFDADAEASAWSSDDRHVAWSKDKNVFVAKPDGSTFQVTHGGFEFLTHGLSVSRVEFGITDGLWWDPTGRRLAFYREDLRPIQAYPYIEWAPRPAKHRLGRYPMAGRAGSVVSVGVYDSRNDSVIWLKTDSNKDQYLTNVTWGPEGRVIYIAHVNRAQNQMDLKAWDARTGEFIRTLFTETDEQWVEPEHGPIFLPDGSGDFLWHSYREGFLNLYLCSNSGQFLQRVTNGDWDVTKFAGFADDLKSIFFQGTGDHPLENHLFQAKLINADQRTRLRKDSTAPMVVIKELPRQLTMGEGQHDASLSPKNDFFFDQHSNLKQVLRVDVVHVSDKKSVTIHEAKNPWDQFQGGSEELFKIKSTTGDDLYGHIILPPNLDKSKKYPVLLYVYGGPHSQLIKNEFGGGASFSAPWFHYMANQGIIVMRIDGHGTAQRGIDFIQAIHRNLGDLEVKDQISGLEYLFQRPYVDRSRVGVHGWSYGGFMTLSLMTRAGDYFKCGVSGAPVTDWAYYETGYGERYMDTPQENPEGYKNAMPASHLDGLKGRLLVVQGSSDETVVWQHTMAFLQACIDQNKPVEYMVYPGQLHGLRGNHRWHFYQKMTKFFLEELQPGK